MKVVSRSPSSSELSPWAAVNVAQWYCCCQKHLWYCPFGITFSTVVTFNTNQFFIPSRCTLMLGNTEVIGSHVWSIKGIFQSNIKSSFAINCLTVFIELEHCLVGGTSCWFKFQAVSYADLHIFRQICLQINSLVPELRVQCDVWETRI